MKTIYVIAFILTLLPAGCSPFARFNPETKANEIVLELGTVGTATATTREPPMPDTPDDLEPWIIPSQEWVLIPVTPVLPDTEAELSD